MKLSHRLGGQSEGRLLWSRWRRLAAPSLFFLGVIYYEELFLKLYCFHGLSLAGAVFTLLFSIPIAMLLGALCPADPANPLGTTLTVLLYLSDPCEQNDQQISSRRLSAVLFP